MQEDSTARMRVTVCRSTGRTTATVSRTLNGDQRHLVVSVPWTQRPIQTWQEVRDLLTPEEAQALAAAFDLDRP
jgi:hypothetical protein